MPLHLIKLCVGVEDIGHLRELQASRLQAAHDAGQPPLLQHITRMTPRRRDELLDGGSLYWVIKGRVQARQNLLDIISFTDGEGIKRCRLVLGHKLIPVRPQPRRAFQGWRYFEASDAPGDLTGAKEDAEEEIPPQMLAELSEMGLL
ncbi:MAG: DUF1489 domain-containing protein [Hyphomicrobiales bacterium]|nr:MAG: DUF1489 domain-containing protein [Hyphomicrobiales bacterium]